MAKSDAARSAEWRRRLLLKASIFDDLNAERAARIRQAFPGDERPEVRAVVEFFANYPRCHKSLGDLYLDEGIWYARIDDNGSEFWDTAAATVALSEVTSLPVVILPCPPTQMAIEQVRDEVAEMRALGLWGRP